MKNFIKHLFMLCLFGMISIGASGAESTVILPTAKNGPWEGKYWYSPSQVDGEWQDGPQEDWYKPDFDDSNWKTIKGSISNNSGTCPEYTRWEGEYDCYWVRRTFTLSSIEEDFTYILKVIHDDDCKVYLNGNEIYNKDSCVDRYAKIPIDKNLLIQGNNTLAIWVSNIGGTWACLDCGITKAIGIDGFVYEFSGNSAKAVECFGCNEDVTIPETITCGGQIYTVTALGANLFEGQSLNSLIIPKTVEIIEDHIVYYNHLNELIFAEGSQLKSIGDWAFCGSRGLTHVTLPSTLETIGHTAFGDCSLEEISIPKSVRSIGDGAFHAGSVISIIVDKENSYYNDGNGSNVIIETATNRLLCGCENSIIPHSVEHIARDAFQGVNIKSINIPSSVISIGEYAFRHSKLEILTLPISVKEIGYCAFGDSPIKTLDLGQVESISPYAFRSCPITTVTIPSSVTYFGPAAFELCNSLETIVVADGNKVYDSRNNCNAIIETASNTLIQACKTTKVPDEINNIAHEACHGINFPTPLYNKKCFFRMSQNLEYEKGFSIPEGIEVIKYDAFWESTIKDIFVPSSVVIIEGHAFYNSSLENIIISGRPTLGERAFAYCGNLKNVIICSPISDNGQAFEESNYKNATLTVPYGCKAAYEVADWWKDFGTIQEPTMGAPCLTANFGKQMVLPIYLNNDESVCGFQFDIELPEGFSIATSGTRVKTYSISLGAERFAGLDHTVTSQLQSDSSVRVLCSSITNANINDDCKDAPVINITINVDASVTPADYMVKLKNITLARFVDAPIEVNLPDAYSTITVLNAFPVTATSSNNAWGTTEITGDNYDSETGNAVIGTNVTLTATPADGFAFVNWTENGEEVSAENPFTFTVNEERNLVAVFTMLGDVYENNIVNITDLSATVGIILNRTTPTRREYVAANIDNDDKIDVADYSNIAAIILNGGVSAAKSDDFTKYVINMQYDMHIPAGLKMNADEIAAALRQTALAKNHSIVTRELENGDIRVLVLSMQNEEIADAKAMLEELAMPATEAIGEYNITLSNIIFAYNDLSKEEVSMMNQKLLLVAPTGIGLTPTLSEGEGASYNLNGQKLQKATNGINIIDGKKYIIK